jgi:phage terminase large subunit
MQTIDLSNRNLWTGKYLKAVLNPKTYNILYGGAGSGKSQTMIQLFLAEITNHTQNQNQTYFVIRKVAGTLRNSVFADFKNKILDWGLDGLVKARSSYLEIHSGTNRIVFLGCDDPEKLKSLSQAKYIWIEEATELTLDDFTQITLRLRGRSNFKKRFFITFNPVSDSHWIKKRFFDEPPEHEKESILKIHATYKDNLDKLDDEYSVRMESLTEVDQTYYEVYAEGIWGVWDRESLFAQNFNFKSHCIDGNIKAKSSYALYLSFDFNVTNTCVVFQYLKNAPDQPRYATINVLKVYRIGDLEDMCNAIRLEFPRMMYVINGDPAGASRKAETKNNLPAYQMIQAFLMVPPPQIQVISSAPSHLATKIISDLCFKKCLVQISIPNCKELIDDFKEAKVDRLVSLDPWKKKNPNRSHALDCWRYFVYGNFREIASDYNLEKFTGQILN